ncbi:MAG: type I-B CRISPR-associated protein Cas5 [Thermoplasmatales archaeon]|nr:type I-B CRISPR-associated protein Cas5 [Thermoplasmatales archaeon]
MQQIDKVLVFDIWGDFAHFRRIETTTSPLTYSIPTGTALSGIVSAILGQERDSYYNVFHPENVRWAVRVLHPLKKIRININLINTKLGFYLWDIIQGKEQPRSPTPFEFLKEPKYRIYIWLKDKELQNKLKKYLQNHQSFYTPYLGISELIANFNFVGEFDNVIELKSKNKEEVHTVIRKDRSTLIVDEEGLHIVKERIPLFMDSNRVVREYVDVFFEANAKPLKVKDTSIYRIGNENVVFI